MSLILNEISKLSEDQAREKFEQIRWPDGPICPHCDSAEVAKVKGEAGRDGLYRCHACQNQFTATVGTILEDSHLPIRTWLMAFTLMCSGKKGVSALQLQRQLGIGSYRTAWHLAHRIRYAMAKEPMKGLLATKGEAVEVDETYVGGKPRKGTGIYHKRGRGTKKTPVMALVERGGRVRAKPIEYVDAKTLKGAIREHVHSSAKIMTDEWKAYAGIGAEFEGGHHVVNHSKGEYARGDVSTNEAESYFALLKRGIIGSFHHVSKKHLPKYVDEFSFRWDHRKINDSDRTAKALKATEGRRLMLIEPKSK